MSKVKVVEAKRDELVVALVENPNGDGTRRLKHKNSFTSWFKKYIAIEELEVFILTLPDGSREVWSFDLQRSKVFKKYRAYKKLGLIQFWFDEGKMSFFNKGLTGETKGAGFQLFPKRNLLLAWYEDGWKRFHWIPNLDIFTQEFGSYKFLGQWIEVSRPCDEGYYSPNLVGFTEWGEFLDVMANESRLLAFRGRRNAFLLYPDGEIIFLSRNY